VSVKAGAAINLGLASGLIRNRTPRSLAAQNNESIIKPDGLPDRIKMLCLSI
jgi:hypothetical protein